LRPWLDGYKWGRCCSRCGFSDPRALDFHHRDSTTKSFNLGEAIWVGLGLKQIAAEVAKCDLVCAN
jgi:hypothetical protein